MISEHWNAHFLTVSRSCLEELGLVSFYQTAGDVKLICLLRASRMFAYGALTLVLVAFLRELHVSQTRIGLFMTLSLVGDVLISFVLAIFAHSVGRRAVLRMGAVLMIVSGTTFFLSQNYWFLLMAAIFGILSPK